MKVTVRNLGVIKEAEVDLKPLTIFVGPNNSGKTWLAYTISSILTRHGLEEYIRAYVTGKIPPAYPPLDNAIQRVLDEGNAKIDLVQFADEYGEIYFNNVASIAPQWMSEFLGTDRTSFENLEAHVQFAETKRAFLDEVYRCSIGTTLGVGRAEQGALITALKEAGKHDFYVYTLEENILEKLPLRAVRGLFINNIFKAFHNALYQSAYIFPAERMTFITFPFYNRVLSDETFVLSETPQQETRGKSLAIPVSHFLDMMSILFGSSLAKRERAAKTDNVIKDYLQHAEILGQHILGGKVDFSTPEPEPTREILFQPVDADPLEIAAVSSMVKELAPLVLYLRYLARSGEWLIIDEPEMNLHPEAQAKLIELLALLVKAKLNILITTHSPYIVDHLANLMKAAENQNQEGLREEFYLKRTDAFIAKDKVSVYQIDNGTAKSILGEDGLIYWDTFGDVSDKVTQIYFKL